VATFYLPFRNSIFDNSRFRDVPTIYLPVAQGVYLLSYLLAPNNLFALKGIFLLCDLVTCGALSWLLARKGLDPRRMIIYAWCPLPIVEYALQGHVDPLTIMLTVLAVVGAVVGEFVGARPRGAGADTGGDAPSGGRPSSRSGPALMSERRYRIDREHPIGGEMSEVLRGLFRRLQLAHQMRRLHTVNYTTQYAAAVSINSMCFDMRVQPCYTFCRCRFQIPCAGTFLASYCVLFWGSRRGARTCDAAARWGATTRARSV